MLYCWKELDWGGNRTCHVHPDGSVLHGGSWLPPPRMRRLANQFLLYAVVTHWSRARTHEAGWTPPFGIFSSLELL